jgi:hypothetical protein
VPLKQILDFLGAYRQVFAVIAFKVAKIVVQRAKALHVNIDTPVYAVYTDFCDLVLTLKLQFIFRHNHVTEQMPKFLFSLVFHPK